MIKIYTGLPGSGKSLLLADQALWLFNQNKNWFKKANRLHKKGIILYRDDQGNPIPPFPRKVFSNIKFAPHIEEKWGDYIAYWVDPEELVKVRDADVIWDEVATHLDSTRWADLPLEIKRWLQQHRKYGCNIYGNTQEFLMIDISMRRLTAEVHELHKMFGSRDPSPTRPPVKKIWGLIIKRRVDPLSYDDEGNRKYLGWPSFVAIKKRYVSAFDTRQEIPMGQYPPLKHIERKCINYPNCKHVKLTHR